MNSPYREFKTRKMVNNKTKNKRKNERKVICSYKLRDKVLAAKCELKQLQKIRQ